MGGAAARLSGPGWLEGTFFEGVSICGALYANGINDAPALAAADVGVAIGVQGATASMVAADAVLKVNELVRLSETRTIALRTRRNALESVIAGLSLSIVAMGVAAAGQLPAVWGALLQEGIDVAVTGNAMGALRFRSEEAPPPSAQAGEPRVGPKGAGDLSNPCLRGAA